ncbi:MAG: VCBS repeat-containing protein, partial [Cyclobacteriaceae bacterium]|nr:VCBS repeat-containing protein [Cyclobacteriaceae bacterium]
QSYDAFALATLEDIYSEQALNSSIHYSVYDFSSCYLENKGNGQFERRNLPDAAQISAINSLISDDFNGDGHPDLLIAGNLYVSEVETTRSDAGIGLLLAGDGRGNFSPVPYRKSGFFAPWDVRALGLINNKKEPLIIVANNNFKTQVFQLKIP